VNELLHTYSTPDIVPVILVVIIAVMAIFWPVRTPPRPNPRDEQIRARRQMDAATRETVRRMREAADDLDDGGKWRL
jgi:hypothetical protein